MALEHRPRIDCVEIGENGSFHAEEVEITPPARRKKKEGKKNRDNTNLPKPTEIPEDETTNNDAVAKVDRSPTVSTALSVNEAGTDDVKLNKGDLSAHGEASVKDELRHGVCETFVESGLQGEVHENSVICKATSFESGVQNSFVDERYLVASANATNVSLNASDHGLSEDAEKKGNSVSQRQTCVSPDITSGGQTSQDEESFFSADSEAETSSELKTLASAEVSIEMLIDSTDNQDCLPASHERSIEPEADFDIAHNKEPSPKCSSETCTTGSVPTEDLTKALNKTARTLEITESLQDSTEEFSCIGTETAWQGVTNTQTYSFHDSDLFMKDTELGAVRDEDISDSQSDEDSSLSSSCTSSEGEYDIMWAEKVRGVKGQNLDNEDTLPEDPVFEILSVFSSTELVSVAVDSEDDSNKGESLGSSLKSTNDVQSSLSPLLNVIDDQNDASSTGEEILACFPRSECPVVVDNSSLDTEMVAKTEPVESAGESQVSLSEAEEKACSDSKILLEDSEQIGKSVVKPDISCDSLDNAVDLSEVGTFSEKVDTSALMDSSNSVRRSGSLRLVNNNGVLKIVDYTKVPVTKENVKEARILRNASLKDGMSLSGQATEDSEIDSNSATAAQVLNETVSEVRKIDEDVDDGVLREIHNVCEDIARLESFSKRDDELGGLACELQDSAPSKDSFNESGELNASDKSEGTMDIGHSGSVIISIDNTTEIDQRTLLEAKRTPPDETNNTLVTESGNSAASNSSSLSRSVDQIIESVDETNRKPTAREKKQRPKRLARFKRYSLDTETALMSPEGEVHAELTKFGSSTTLDDQLPALVTTASETGTSTAAEMVTDGQRDETYGTPSPPPRSHSSKLKYSASFSAAAAPGRLLAPKEEKRSKRGRSDRWKTLPNNTFDPQADKWSFARLGAALKLSSAPTETDEVPHQLPLTLITDEMAATFPNFPLERRAQIALELYTTERSYVRGLETIIQLFKKPCEERKLLDKKEIEAIFHNIEDVYRVNKDVLFNLLERIKHWHDQQCVGDIFVDQGLKIFDRMKIYAKFCNNYNSAETLYKQKLKRSKEFEAFLNACYEHTVCQPGLNLPAYLITVVQRIPRYLLLLRDLMERTPENHADHSNLSKALGKMNHLAVYINNQLETVVGQKAMDELRLRVIGLKALEGRALIKEADVTLNGLKKTRQCLLFNDMLVFAAKGVSKTSEVEQTIDVTTLWCMDLEGNNPQSTKEDSLEIFTPEKSYIIYVGTKTEKKVWLQKLRTAIAMALHGSEATDKDEIEYRKSKFTYKDGRTYWGNFVSGKRHGQGVLSWPNQTRYQGHWEDNDRNGRGELTYNSGDKYIGDWLDDKQHGFGRMEYTTGDAYCGEWYQGNMHGVGEIRFKNGDWYKGEFYHNEVEGEGELNCVSGLLYKGTWKHSKKHGKGRMQFSNGDIYIGEFVNDRISGQGEMMYADGSIYKGSWINNQRHGTGELTRPDGSHYLGGWIGDEITGKGCMTYSNGDYYDGVWFKNLRFGQGLMKYSNGNSYEGGFVYDLCNNHGMMRYKDGSEYVGNWSNGLHDGRGKMTYANGSIYEGDWMNGMRHGEGTLTLANKANYRGRWELDKQHGRGMYEDKSTGYHFEGEWQDGRKAGRGVERTSEGSYEGEWKDNMRHGQGTEELSCGTKFEGGWKENRKHGSGRKILKTGMIEAQVWQDGHLVEMSSIILIELPLIQRR